MVLICLLAGIFNKSAWCYYLATLLLVLNMIWPSFYNPAAKVWFGFSKVIGTFVSKLLLSLIFFLILTPTGLLRRLIGFDSLQLKKWKKDNSSAFNTRDHDYIKTDIESLY